MSDLLNANLSAGAPQGQPTTPAGTPAATSEAPSTSSSTVTLSSEQFQQLLAAAQSPGSSSASAAPATPATPPSKTSLFSKGALVRHTYFDTYTGRSVTRHGVVVEVLEATADTEASFARSVVGWFADVSGPIGDHELEAD